MFLVVYNMIILEKLLCGLFVILVELNTSFGSYPLTLITPKHCGKNEYFDPVCISCKQCGARDDIQVNRQLISSDGSLCVCKPQYFLKQRKGPYNIVCESCPEGKVVSSDGNSCISCGEENPFNKTIGACGLCNSSNSTLIVENGKKQLCIPCEEKFISDATKTSCRSCSGDYILRDGKCVCLTNLTFSGGFCLPLVRDKPSLFSVEFENGVHITSAFFIEHFNAAYYGCKERNNVSSCQMLANMCVMLLYKLGSRVSGDDNACSEYMALVKEKHNDCHEKRSFGLWLYYNDQDARNELYKSNVPNIYDTNPVNNSSKLHFLAMKYNVKGKLLQMEKLKPYELQLCQGPSSKESIVFTFGTRIQEKCMVSTQDLWDFSSLIFYDLFLMYEIKSNKSMVYPVPVLIRNLKKNGEYVNKGRDESKWQLVRRFFLTDTVSGIEDKTDADFKYQMPSKVFRYASDVSLRITLKNDLVPGSIYPPLLTISYSELTFSDYLNTKRVPVSFSVSYLMDQSGVLHGIKVAVSCLSVTAFLWSLIQSWTWFRRSGKQAIDIVTLGKFLIFLCGNLATVFFVVMFCAALNWLILFKNQDVVHILLPTPEEENILRIYLGVAFAMKVLDIIHLLAVHCTVDIFFIDWERPQAQKSSASSRILSAVDTGSVAETTIPTGRKAYSGKITSEKISTEMAGVSIWRTYFAANEWAEIQSLRKINLSIQLFATLFFLKVVGLEEFAFATPLPNSFASEIHKNVPFSACCRFALGSSVYLSIALIQILFRKVIYERFIEDKLQQYIDLCSVSNVSVFIMLSQRFGYYIHGRSAHGRADVNMKEMHEQLRREEEDLCGHRGLLPNTEQQTFQMGLPVGVYEQFQKLLSPLSAYSQAADRMQGVGGHLSKVDIDRVSSTYQTINKFLSGFIEHAFKDFDYIVKDKVFLENLFDVECYESPDRGYFYNDDGHSFDSVLLLGNECTLLIFDILLFSIIDISSSDYVLSAVITFLIGKAIQSIRSSAGRRNLVRKALVDERFLT